MVTPEEIPAKIVAHLDEQAGKQHSQEGLVLTTLAECLTMWDEREAQSMTEAEVQEPMSKPLSDERLAEIRDLHVNGGHGLPPVTAVFVLIGALGELVAEVDRLRRLTSYGIQVSVDVSTDDDPYARLWGRTAGWNYSDDGPVLLVEMEQTADA